MIDYARAAADPTRRLYPHQIDTTGTDERHRVWLCGGCTARVAPRRSHTRAGGTRVLAHFATWPRADGDPTPHDDACSFLPPARAERTPPPEHPSPPRQTPDTGPTTWLLAAAKPPTTDPERAEPVAAHAPPNPPTSTRGGRHPDKPTQPTITGAHRILDLLRRFDDDPMQMLRFTALWRPGPGQPAAELSWGDLYYPPGRHHLLLRRAHDQLLPGHPVAVSGPVEHIAHTHNRRRQGDDLSIFLRLGEPGTPHRLVLRGPPDLMPAHIERGHPLLALATWTEFTPNHGAQTRDTGPPTYCTAWITQPGQVLELNPADPFS